MKKGRIIYTEITEKTAGTTGEFELNFQNANFGPYSHLFQRENLYYDDESGQRGSYFFPLKNTDFQNTEIFLETNDIVVCVGRRGSFSGESKQFIEIVSLKTAEKHRLYPDAVSLIYNTKNSIIIYYKKSETHKKLELDKKTLEKVSGNSQHLDAFFKLYYNHTNKNYGRLIYKANSRSHQAGYFLEEDISSDLSKPIHFHRKKFSITCDEYGPISIDVWEASLTGQL